MTSNKQDWEIMYYPPNELFPFIYQAEDCDSKEAWALFLKDIPSKRQGPKRMISIRPTMDYGQNLKLASPIRDTNPLLSIPKPNSRDDSGKEFPTENS